MSLPLSMFKKYLKLLLLIAPVMFLLGCDKKLQEVVLTPKITVSGTYVEFKDVRGWEADAHGLALELFNRECTLKKIPNALNGLCPLAKRSKNAKAFFETNFRIFKLHSNTVEERLLTGYYEPQFEGSLKKSKIFSYPLYKRPKDLLVVKLDGLYSDLKSHKLRGRLQGKKVVPYYSRAEINAGKLKERPLCYMKSDVDRFFLQVQGSGRIVLSKTETIFVGYDGQNGHPYRSIGKALVASGAIPQEQISLQSIRKYLDENLSRSKAVLESNPSFVFFGKRECAASGASGMVLTPMRSVAVDRSKIPLGYPLFLQAIAPITHKPLDALVFAQDTGGAIKGQVRADLFCGFGAEAEALAGELKSPLNLYILLPNNFHKI